MEYQGQLIDGVPNGYGCLKTPAYTYTGYMKNGIRNGYGQTESATGRMHQGYYDNDQETGLGIVKED